MAAVEVGGNGSVQWFVSSDHVRRTELRHAARGSKGHEQRGVDEVDPGEQFTVSIRMPRNASERAALVATLKQLVADAEASPGDSSARITFKLPIEDHRPDQIQILWNSKAQ